MMWSHMGLQDRLLEVLVSKKIYDSVNQKPIVTIDSFQYKVTWVNVGIAMTGS